jgi:hypothetical protein
MNKIMKKACSILLFFLLMVQIVNCQTERTVGIRILFHGLVVDAATLSPLANTQIIINRSFALASDKEGSFAFWVSRNDTVVFKSLGYKSTTLYISDTLSGKEFIAGIYLKSDTLDIGEVIIVPRIASLKSELFKAKPEIRPEIENAKFNLAVSAYQGRQMQSSLGDPAANYEMLRQKQRFDAYEKGGIPSDRMIGLSPFMLLPAAYLLIHGLPENPQPLAPNITRQEIDQINNKYLETLRQRE